MMIARSEAKHLYTLHSVMLQIFIFVSTQKKVIGCVVADQIEKVMIIVSWL